MSNGTYQSYNTMTRIHSILMQITIPYSIIISLIGIPGNVLTIIMLSKRSLTKNFNNCTLIALASTDLLFNFSLVSRCIIDLTLSMSINFCQLLAFLSHLAELLSAWFTVHFTVQRFIAVRFPLSVFIEKNIHLLHYSIVSLFILAGVTYCYALVRINDYDDCQEDLRLGWFLSDALSSFVIPFLLIATLNCLIIVQLRKTYRHNQQLSFTKRSKSEYRLMNQRKKILVSYESSSHSRYYDNSVEPSIKSSAYQFPSSEGANDQYLSVSHIRPRTASIRSTTRYHAQSHRVTRMLILVSTCFLLLNAPSHICSISLELYTLRKSATRTNASFILLNDYFNETTSNFYPSSTISPRRQVNSLQIFYIILIISKHVAYLSYSINFLLYSFCGMKFREDLMKFLTHCRFRTYHRPVTKTPIIIQENSF